MLRPLTATINQSICVPLLLLTALGSVFPQKCAFDWSEFTFPCDYISQSVAGKMSTPSLDEIMKKQNKHAASGWMNRLSTARLMTHFCVTVIQTASESTGSGKRAQGLEFLKSFAATSCMCQAAEIGKIRNPQLFCVSFPEVPSARSACTPSIAALREIRAT